MVWLTMPPMITTLNEDPGSAWHETVYSDDLCWTLWVLPQSPQRYFYQGHFVVQIMITVEFIDGLNFHWVACSITIGWKSSRMAHHIVWLTCELILGLMFPMSLSVGFIGWRLFSFVLSLWLRVFVVAEIPFTETIQCSCLVMTSNLIRVHLPFSLIATSCQN